ncbi:hypothetical protein Syun_015795 [Stephania yunnanensis]|uniref:Uncharacterized protein n=1 Tax=Stephania yunnanensis TaxID=152371 RepID=A0AAP0PDB9_9MAGN
MPLFWNERRGPEWKQGWVGQTMSAASLPPLPLLTVFAIVLLFLSLSHHASLKEKMHHNVINFKLVLFVVPAALIFITRSMIYKGKIALQGPRLDTIRQGGGSACGVALLVLLLLVMISYKSSFDSMWW